MPEITFDRFDGGLFLEGRKDSLPEGALRRNRGIHPDSTTVLESRDGATLSKSLDSHSLTEFNDLRFQGSGTTFYRDGSSIKTGLTGERLRMIKMPTQTGFEDALFVAGGGDLFKVQLDGTVSQWGIDAPTTDPSAATGDAGVLTGTFQYKITFKNSTTGSRSNANPTAVSVTPSSDKVDLSSIPVSSDAQVDTREIWRTVAGGAAFFLLDTIDDNVTTIYTDNIPDTSLGIQLPVDNTPPLDTYDGCFGPQDARMWWYRIDIAGQRGRVYYSPKSRPESVEGFIDISPDDDGVQEMFVLNSQLYAITKSKVYQISGTAEEGLFTTPEIGGTLGIVNPFTLAVHSTGAFYQAQDSVVKFDGTRSSPVNPLPVQGIFKGKTLENISAFTGLVAAASENEYFISDTTNTLVFHIEKQTWRDLGIGAKAFFFEKETGQLQASFNSKTLLLEDEMTTTDDGTAISFEVELPSVSASPDRKGILRYIYVEIDTTSQNITSTLLLDGTEVALPVLNTSGRTVQQLPVMKYGNIAGVRFAGSLTAKCKIYKVMFDVYIPQPQQELSNA